MMDSDVPYVKMLHIIMLVVVGYHLIDSESLAMAKKCLVPMTSQEKPGWIGR